MTFRFCLTRSPPCSSRYNFQDQYESFFKLKLKTCITILASQTATKMFLKQTTKPSYSKTTRRAIIIYRIYMGDHFLKLSTSSPQLSTQASFNCFCGCLRYRRCLTKFLIKRNSMDATFTCISSTNSYANLSSGITLSTRLAVQLLNVWKIMIQNVKS